MTPLTPLTNHQKKVLERFNEELPRILDTLKSLSKDLDSAFVELPCKNEEGQSVVHRSNMYFHHRKQAIDYIINLLDNP